MTGQTSPLRVGDWFRKTVFYEIPVRSFYDSNGDGIGDLPGVTAKLDYLKGLGIGALWLLPFHRSPWRDEGYDISDHYSVHPLLGTLDDLDHLVAESHAREIRVVGDLVTNHVSIDHLWFQQARTSRSSPFRPWFLWSDTGKEFSRARVIFKDFEQSNWTWDETAGQFYFHRFYETQPDLNYDHPAVREEMLKVVRFWLNRGLDGFRCDAVPYLYKREGTNCQSLPEVHRFFQEVRALMDAEFPGTALIAEANQTVSETVPYFDAGREFQMVMHFPLMPNLYLALAESAPQRVRQVLQATLPVPAECAWAHFLRNHDELTLEQVSDEERARFLGFYGSDTRAILNGSVRRRLAPLLGGDDASILLMTAVILGLPGSAFLYYGDEVGMGDRLDLPDRDGVRTPMQWDNGPNAGFSTAPADHLVRPVVQDPEYAPAVRSVAVEEARTDSLLHRVRDLLRVYNDHTAVLSSHQFVPVDLGDSPVLAYWRPGSGRDILCLYNFGTTETIGTVPLPAEVEVGPVEVLAGAASCECVGNEVRFRLARRSFTWARFLAPEASVLRSRLAPAGG
jgi:maltose alpha-D-glucosyltransferase / alpha-amylase